jgi:hypothetical protein
MYKQIKDFRINSIVGVSRLSDGASIPFAPDNTDHQEYLKWVAEGNEPLPPDESENSTET